MKIQEMHEQSDFGLVWCWVKAVIARNHQDRRIIMSIIHTRVEDMS